MVVVGGTGGFGRRLVEGLVATSDFDVVIASRNQVRGEVLAASLAPGRVTAVALDTGTVTAAALRQIDAFAVVDAAGPFQGADYRLARAAIEAGLHYVDLADARDFVAGFGALDAPARAAGVVALSGASSTPALSHAVLDRLTAGWRRIDRIEVAISPGNRASPRGLAVFRSILSYVGRPVRIFTDCGWTIRPGWSLTVRPDMPGLGRRWQSLCETPDLDLLPARFAPREAALFRAGLELSVVHLGLLALSLLVRAGMLHSLVSWAPLLRWAAEMLARFGSDCGGMTVEAAGIDSEGRNLAASWSLVATHGDGPFIPTLPALAALRAIAAGTVPAGAGACVGVLDLAAIECEFAPYHISSVMNESPAASPFQQLLGADFARLPEPVQRIHSLTHDIDTAGQADIATARNPMAWLLCRLAGLPRPGTGVAVGVSFHPDGRGGEFWSRHFEARRYASTMQAGSGRDAGLLVERFWPFAYFHRLSTSPQGVAWKLVKWRLLGIPLPRWTVPDINCVESADGERYCFAIDVVFPLVGPVIHYRGWLLPA